MRVFVPLLLRDLQAERILATEIVTATYPQGKAHPDEVEQAEYDACLDASLASLELIRDRWDEEPVKRRTVAVAEVDAVDEEAENGYYEIGWDKLRAIFIDDDDACDLITGICLLTDQDRADEAVYDLVENHPLIWFDASERIEVSNLK